MENQIAKYSGSFALIVLLVFVSMISLFGCAAKPVATKYNSPVMRVMIDPVGLTQDQFAQLQTSVVQSGKFIVVDRNNGFDAVKREQERQHETDSDRFDNREKYAHWAKLHGAGGVIVANTQCERKAHFIGGYYNQCRQTVHLIHANTGEVLAAVETYADSEDGWNMMPSWDLAMDKLNKNMPKNFEHDEDKSLVAYKDLSEQLAKDHKRKPVSEDNDQ
jgi:hypothetical protein